MTEPTAQMCKVTLQILKFFHQGSPPA